MQVKHIVNEFTCIIFGAVWPFVNNIHVILHTIVNEVEIHISRSVYCIKMSCGITDGGLVSDLTLCFDGHVRFGWISYDNLSRK